MSTLHHEQTPATRRVSGPGWPVTTALLMVALVGGFYLLREHWDHVAGNRIYLMLLACGLMHLFHGHGGHGQGRHGSRSDQSTRQGGLKS